MSVPTLVSSFYISAPSYACIQNSPIQHSPFQLCGCRRCRWCHIYFVYSMHSTTSSPIYFHPTELKLNLGITIIGTFGHTPLHKKQKSVSEGSRYYSAKAHVIGGDVGLISA